MNTKVAAAKHAAVEKRETERAVAENAAANMATAENAAAGVKLSAAK